MIYKRQANSEKILRLGESPEKLGDTIVRTLRNKGMQNIAKQDLGTAMQNRQARPVIKFSQQGTNHYFGICTRIIFIPLLSRA